MYEFGSVVLAEVHFTDTFEIKARPAVVLFEEEGNVVVMGISSNLEMKGIPLTRKEGAVRDSVIKLNYIFTISDKMIKRFLFNLSDKKKEVIRKELGKRLGV